MAFCSLDQEPPDRWATEASTVSQRGVAEQQQVMKLTVRRKHVAAFMSMQNEAKRENKDLLKTLKLDRLRLGPEP